MNRSIELFSAGCPICQDAIELVKSIAGSERPVTVHDVRQEAAFRKAAEYGVRSVPAVAVGGRLVDCCAGRGPDKTQIRAAISTE